MSQARRARSARSANVVHGELAWSATWSSLSDTEGLTIMFLRQKPNDRQHWLSMRLFNQRQARTVGVASRKEVTLLGNKFAKYYLLRSLAITAVRHFMGANLKFPRIE